MTPENFVIPWRLTNDNGKLIDFQNKLNPVLTYYQYVLNSTGQILTKQVDIGVTKCNTENAKMPEFTTKVSLDDWYCMDWTKDNFTFGGYWDGS